MRILNLFTGVVRFFAGRVERTELGMADFFRRGTSKVYFVPTIAATTKIPTAAEVTAGTDLSPRTTGLEGFEYQNQPIDIPKLSSAFTGTIPGPDSVARSTITFLEDKTTNPLRTTLAKGITGYLVIFPGGIAGATPAAADKCDVWPVIVTGKPRVISMGSDPATWRAGFTPSDTPAEDVAVT